MNEPTSDHVMARQDQITPPTIARLPVLPIELLDACGNGYTAADLARVLAARARATGPTRAA
jgi:hypothetical protein